MLVVDVEAFEAQRPVDDDEAFARRLQQAPDRSLLEDEELARRLQEEEEEEEEKQPPKQMYDDEMFARSLELADRLSSSSHHMAAAGSGSVETDDSGEVAVIGQELPLDPSQASQASKVTSQPASGLSQELSAELDLASRMELAREKDLPPEVLDEVNVLWEKWRRGEEVDLKQPPAARNYKLHAVHALLQEFPRAPAQAVQEAFDKFNSYRQARDLLESADEKNKLKAKRTKSKAPPCKMPKTLAREMKPGSKFMTAAMVFQQRKKKHEERVNELRAVGGLGTCGCCFSDEVLPEAELRCNSPEGHGFCIPCVRQHALGFFGPRLFALNLRQNSASSGADADPPGPLPFFQRARQLFQGGSGSSSPAEAEPPPATVDLSCSVLRCMQMSAGCTGHFNDKALQTALPVKEYVRYSRRSAALQAAASGLKDLVACPTCDFMIEMSDPSDGIVRCLDPECGKVTCRWCREDTHPGLRCDEVEKDGEVKIRTFLEEHLTESSVSKCPNPKCKKKLVRSEGCNHIQCPCGTHACYLCGVKINALRPYDHYKDGSKGGGTNNDSSHCTTYGTPAWAKKSDEKARAEAEEALEEYLKANPELQEIMQARGDVVKRTLLHVAPSGSQAKRRRKSK